MICSQCAINPSTPVTKGLETLPETTSKLIQDLLASNVAPLGRERESLSDLMSRTQLYATSLDARIAELHATLEHLLDQKVTTEQRVCDLKVILHPIRIVPPEIFAQIFDEAVSDAALIPLENVRDGHFPNSIDTDSQSRVISRVSSGWRRTALSTPYLWRFVHVSFDRYPRNLSTSIFLHRFLALSAEQMLHVVLHATVDHPAMTVVLVVSKRWRIAALSFPPPIYRSWNVPDLSFRSLEKLHLHLQLDGLHTVQDLRAGNHGFTLNTPQLRAFSSDTVGACFLVVRPRFSRLTCFQQTGVLDEQVLSPLHGVSSLAAPVIMLEIPFLTSALFRVSKAVPDAVYSQITTTCPIRDAYPKLHSLILCGTSAGYRNFFSKFNLPCLELLSLEDSELGGDLVAFPSPLVAPTGQHLQQLKVPIHNADDTDSLAAFLRTTPKLRRLELRARTHFDVSHTIHSVLVDKKDLLPDLTDLVITSMDPDGVEISDAFVEAIKYRRAVESQVAKLQEVLVRYVPVAGINLDVVVAFNDLLSDGLRGSLKFCADLTS